MFRNLSLSNVQLRPLSEAAAKAHARPSDAAAAQECIDLISRLPKREQRIGAALELALYEPPGSVLKEAAANAWEKHVKSVFHPPLRVEYATRAMETACYTELAPGLAREGEHTRAEDEAHAAPILRRGLSIMLDNIDGAPSRVEMIDRLIGFGSGNRAMQTALLDARAHSPADEEGSPKRSVLTRVNSVLFTSAAQCA